jgi:hypothetical protein
VDVVDDAALLIECRLQFRRASVVSLELIAKIRIGLLEDLLMTGQVAASLADQEAEGGRQRAAS